VQIIDDPAEMERVAADLATCDHVITVDVGSAYGPLATAMLRLRVRRLHLVPGIYFSGFHPDTVDVPVFGVNLQGPTGGYHSRLAVTGFLAGLSPRATADLYNRLSFARLGYFRHFAEQRALLLERYDVYRFDMRAPFGRWLSDGCFMHSATHPRMRVMVDLARVVCGLMGQPVPETLPAEASLPDPLAGHATHPVFPDIAAAIDIAPAGGYRGAIMPGQRARVMSTEAFVAASHEVLARAPRAALRAVPGVSAALAALGLTERMPVRAMPPPLDDLSTVFMAYHGTVLAMETASAMLVQRGVLNQHADMEDLVAVVPALPIDNVASSGMMGGVTITPAADNTVTIRRGGKYLSAERATRAVRFNRDACGPWECLLPMRARDLQNLRKIASSSWTAENGQRILQAAIRVLPGFGLALGPYRLDLRHHLPVRVAGDDGIARFTLEATAGSAKVDTITLTEDTAPSAAAQVLLDEVPDYLWPAEIGTPEEFRLTRNAKLNVPMGPEWFYPPIDVRDADRDWLYDQYFKNAEPWGIGRHYASATLFRARETTLLLSRSIEGTLLGRNGVMNGLGYVRHSKELPRHIDSVGTDRVMNADILTGAPSIEGPVCVFYNGNLQNYFHWLAESMVALHVMVPFLPPGTRLVLPGAIAAFRRSGITGFDHAAYLAALGFGHLATLHVEAPAVRLSDAIWLENDSIFTMPAGMLQSFRARAMAVRPAASGPRRRLYIKRTHLRRVVETDALEAFLKPHGFESVILENTPVTAQMDMFLNAEYVVAPHGAALANLLFCPPGTRVLEISPDCEYRPFFWVIAQKLGLIYGAMPCPTVDGTFNGDLSVDPPRFKALFRMLRAMMD
jgi:hypothetical protein